jgi:hypothetical protein
MTDAHNTPIKREDQQEKKPQRGCVACGDGGSLYTDPDYYSQSGIGPLCVLCSQWFGDILDRFDDETALRYIWEYAFVKGLFTGAFITSIIVWVLS